MLNIGFDYLTRYLLSFKVVRPQNLTTMDNQDIETLFKRVNRIRRLLELAEKQLRDFSDDFAIQYYKCLNCDSDE